MQTLFALFLVLLAFVLGLMMEPLVSIKWGYAAQLMSARDSVGLCGGTSTPCSDGAREPEYLSPVAPIPQQPIDEPPLAPGP